MQIERENSIVLRLWFEAGFYCLREKSRDLIVRYACQRHCVRLSCKHNHKLNIVYILHPSNSTGIFVSVAKYLGHTFGKIAFIINKNSKKSIGRLSSWQIARCQLTFSIFSIISLFIQQIPLKSKVAQDEHCDVLHFSKKIQKKCLLLSLAVFD